MVVQSALPYTDLFTANQKIAAQQLEIEQLLIARNAQARRANHAEQLYHQLETQLITDQRETKSLYTKIKLGVDRDRHDAEIGKLRSEGWEFVCDGTFIDNSVVERYTTLERIKRVLPVPDQPQMTEETTVQESLTVVETAIPADPVSFPPAHPSISNLWNALYDMDRFAELVQHWPDLPTYAPRVHAIFTDAGCDMTNVVIMKSYRPGRRDDVLTVKVIFPLSRQVVRDLRSKLTGKGLDRLIEREGREFIFDLPEDWLTIAPRKTITASSMTIMTEGENSAIAEASPAGEYELPPYQNPPVGMTSDERVELRLQQIRAADTRFINSFIGGQ